MLRPLIRTLIIGYGIAKFESNAVFWHRLRFGNEIIFSILAV